METVTCRCSAKPMHCLDRLRDDACVPGRLYCRGPGQRACAGHGRRSCAQSGRCGDGDDPATGASAVRHIDRGTRADFSERKRQQLEVDGRHEHVDLVRDAALEDVVDEPRVRAAMQHPPVVGVDEVKTRGVRIDVARVQLDARAGDGLEKRHRRWTAGAGDRDVRGHDDSCRMTSSGSTRRCAAWRPQYFAVARIMSSARYTRVIVWD